MIELEKDIWEVYHTNLNSIIVIPTNGYVKENGECVMGRGLALDAKKKFPEIPKLIGTMILNEGNKVFYLKEFRIITLPVKHKWWEIADINLIKASMVDLLRLYNEFLLPDKKEVFLPRPGCGNGQLRWTVVKKFIEPYLEGTLITVVYLPGK